MFSTLSKTNLAKALVLKNTPVYVQFYITARCNLTCQQCNIIYANSDVRECTLDEIKRIADNFADLGVAMVLLTGGEPFIRQDLPEIIQAFESRGVHVRMQTNGLASEEQIAKAVEAGGRDISISLDSLWPDIQDGINGEFQKSWHKALKAMSFFMKHLPLEGSFAALGCVLQRENVEHIPDLIRFGTEIGWFTSLVPIHVTHYLKPMSFRTFDQSRKFRPEEYDVVDHLIEKVRTMRKDGYYLYDSDQYLDDIKRFVKQQRITWRDKNRGVCDSPNLYFAVLPNGAFAPCCDHRIEAFYPTYASNFPEVYRSHKFRDDVYDVTSKCDGCMYGSYPEMTIAMRFWAATLERARLFLTSPPKKPWPMTYEYLLETAEKMREGSSPQHALRSR